MNAIRRLLLCVAVGIGAIAVDSAEAFNPPPPCFTGVDASCIIEGGTHLCGNPYGCLEHCQNYYGGEVYSCGPYYSFPNTTICVCL